jgi:hypothetical protein
MFYFSMRYIYGILVTEKILILDILVQVQMSLLEHMPILDEASYLLKRAATTQVTASKRCSETYCSSFG